MSVQKQKDKKSLKRHAFLKAAQKIFSEKGFQSANVTDIVSEVKSGQGTFYYHFRDKQAIFDELMIGFIDKLTAVLIENEVQGAGQLALVDRDLSVANARRIASVYLDNIALAALFFRESRYVGGEAMQRMDRLYALLYAQVENGLKQGQSAGLVREELDPIIAARCFVGATERAVFEAVRSGGPYDLDHLAEQIVDYQSVGILSDAQRTAYKARAGHCTQDETNREQST